MEGNSTAQSLRRVAASARAAADSPWKLANELRRRLALPWVRVLFAVNGISWGRGWRLHGTPIIQKHRRSLIRFGSGLGLRSWVRSNPLGITHPVILCTWQAGAVIEAGTNFAMSGGTLCAASRITIGDNVAIGANTTVVDNDFHPLAAQGRRLTPQNGKTAPVTIEDDVFIGMSCLVLKGVRLGRGCVIGAGSVVASDVPAGVIAAGNPARPIKRLELVQCAS